MATAVMYNRGVGNEQLEGFLNPFYGGTYPAMTFRAFMNRALDPSDCGSFPPPANIKATKGTTYKKPAPKCKNGKVLNGAKTKCVTPPPPKCPAGTVLTPDQKRCVTPTPTPTEPTPTGPTPTPAGTTKPECDANPDWKWNPPLGPCTLK